MSRAKPWDRQPREPIAAYLAFCAYRDLGPERSIAKASDTLGRKRSSLRLLETWSAQFNWVERAARWEAEIERRARKGAEAELVKMRQEHILVARSMIGVVKKRLAWMLEHPTQLRPCDVAAWVKVATMLERLSRDEAGEVTEFRMAKGLLLPSAVDEDTFATVMQQLRSAGKLPGMADTVDAPALE